MENKRIPVPLLAASAAFLIALAVSEGYAPKAVTTAADPVPTGGFGSTKNEKGTPLKPGEAMPPVRALVVLREHVARNEIAFKASLPNVALTQGEFDLYMDFIYQYGIGTWNKSSMRPALLAGNYRAACDALLKYRYSNGADCSAPDNKTCRGVWTRQQERHRKCIAEVEAAGGQP
ncbi:MAG: lysozyme [Proteobacteria bacterium]|nr:lysozyme [Pseudomonadota bacterium]